MPPATGLRRTGAGAGLSGLDRINRRIVATRIRQAGTTAHFTCKGEVGYMPMVGHLAEAGVVIHVAPATQNREFIRACEARRPRGRRIAHVRIDSAGCQADLFNHCEDHGQSFAIGARLDAPTRAAIAAIPESAWKPCADSMVAETTHSMNGPRKAFRLIVVKRAQQAELLEAGVEDDAPRYHVIASNRRESTEATLIWYRQRGDVSENGIKERKLGFGMQCMPCGQFAANAEFGIHALR